MNMDNKIKELTENKVEKSVRNSKALEAAIKRASKGEYDTDIDSSKGMQLLKITEKWTIRKVFSIIEGKHFYKLFKEVFYINDPAKKYYDTVEPTIYRRVAAQKEHGDLDWAKAVAAELNATIIEE